MTLRTARSVGDILYHRLHKFRLDCPPGKDAEKRSDEDARD